MQRAHTQTQRDRGWEEQKPSVGCGAFRVDRHGWNLPVGGVRAARLPVEHRWVASLCGGRVDITLFPSELVEVLLIRCLFLRVFFPHFRVLWHLAVFSQTWCFLYAHQKPWHFHQLLLRFPAMAGYPAWNSSAAMPRQEEKSSRTSGSKGAGAGPRWSNRDGWPRVTAIATCNGYYHRVFWIFLLLGHTFFICCCTEASICKSETLEFRNCFSSCCRPSNLLKWRRGTLQIERLPSKNRNCQNDPQTWSDVEASSKFLRSFLVDKVWQSRHRVDLWVVSRWCDPPSAWLELLIKVLVVFS